MNHAIDITAYDRVLWLGYLRWSMVVSWDCLQRCPGHLGHMSKIVVRINPELSRSVNHLSRIISCGCLRDLSKIVQDRCLNVHLRFGQYTLPYHYVRIGLESPGAGVVSNLCRTWLYWCQFEVMLMLGFLTVLLSTNGKLLPKTQQV